jgi:hypothetical protein
LADGERKTFFAFHVLTSSPDLAHCVILIFPTMAAELTAGARRREGERESEGRGGSAVVTCEPKKIHTHQVREEDLIEK